jgi:hypothetical protein
MVIFMIEFLKFCRGLLPVNLKLSSHEFFGTILCANEFRIWYYSRLDVLGYNWPKGERRISSWLAPGTRSRKG